ncbi:unnamed protein product [Polarella glacialis]|uniref:Uncharacterized protein n=1 Tax=Polarella glacialis TaxID=89957 RepID=A0A813L5V6_POLGL|nr:unnamed protein product [Polarella glacialis]
MVTVSDRTLKLNVRPLREVLLQVAGGAAANETRPDSCSNTSNNNNNKHKSNSNNSNNNSNNNCSFSEPSVSAVLRALKPVAFQYKSRPPEATGASNGSQESLAGLVRFGFVADELAETLPQLLRQVTWQGRSSTVKGVVYQDLIAVLTAVAQEHEARLYFWEEASRGLEQWRINEQNVHRLLAERLAKQEAGQSQLEAWLAEQFMQTQLQLEPLRVMQERVAQMESLLLRLVGT